MKTFRILAIIPLTLMSLMNLGYPFGNGDSKPSVGVSVAVVVLGLAGLAAVYGLARDTTWGVSAAVAVAGVNVIGAIIALVNDSEGAAIGLTVSSIALLLSLAASTRRRTAAAA
jgi:hypothetical protein